MRKNLISLLTLAISITVILLISRYFFNVPEPQPDSKAIESIFTLPVSDFKPEPNERKLFIISALLSPILCVLFYFLLNRLRIVLSKGTKLFAQALLITAPLFLFLLVYYSIKKYPFFELSSIKSSPLLTFIVAIFLFLALATSLFNKKKALASEQITSILYYGVGISLIGLVAVETLHSDTEPVIFIRDSFEHLHFMAYFDAIAQTYLGKSPIELNPQYGYYPFFLNPLFQITGLTILKFTIVMSFLKSISYLGMLITLRKLTENWLVALTGFITMLFYTRIRVPLDMGVEPYFQYNPHRLLFPALLIFLVWLYVSRQSKLSKNIVYSLTCFAASISILWNPDTGIVVFMGWLLILGYIELLDLREKGLRHLLQKIAKHAAINAGILGLVILGFCSQTYVQTGSWPNLANNFQYTSLFYNYGFYMLPLPRELHPWLWVTLSYIVGIYLSLGHQLDVNHLGSSSIPDNRELDTKSILFFTISIIGTGVFLYYQGRSHNYNLVSISWPAYLLLTIFTDTLLKNIARIAHRKSARTTRVSLSGRYFHQLVLFSAFFYFLGSSIPTFAIHLPEYMEVVSGRLAGINQTNHLLTQQAEFINSTSVPGDTVLILADEATELYLYTNHQRPLDIPGFGEMVLKVDINKLDNFLMHPPAGIKIYWDMSFRMADPRIYANLAPVVSSRNLILFQPKDQ